MEKVNQNQGENYVKKIIILSVFSFSVFAQAKVSLIKLVKKDASVQKIQSAIQQGADIHERSAFRYTPLILAAKKSRPDIIKLLLQAGADVNARNNIGQTALMYASEKGNLESVKLLLAYGADVNAKDKHSGQTALMEAAWGTSVVDVIKALLQAGADVNARSGRGGMTALMMAAQEGKAEFVKLLLAYGADVNARTGKGQTALFWAYEDWYGPLPFFKEDRKGTIEALLRAGAVE